MSDAAALKAAAEAAEAAVTQQGDAVRALKASLKQGEATKVRKGRKGRDALDDDGPPLRSIDGSGFHLHLAGFSPKQKHRAFSAGT